MLPSGRHEASESGTQLTAGVLFGRTQLDDVFDSRFDSVPGPAAVCSSSLIDPANRRMLTICVMPSYFATAWYSIRHIAKRSASSRTRRCPTPSRCPLAASTRTCSPWRRADRWRPGSRSHLRPARRSSARRVLGASPGLPSAKALPAGALPGQQHSPGTFGFAGAGGPGLGRWAAVAPASDCR